MLNNISVFLQARFAILQNPSRFWSMDIITNIMFAYCIIHNMIIEDEADIEKLEDIILEVKKERSHYAVAIS